MKMLTRGRQSCWQPHRYVIFVSWNRPLGCVNGIQASGALGPSVQTGLLQPCDISTIGASLHGFTVLISYFMVVFSRMLRLSEAGIRQQVTKRWKPESPCTIDDENKPDGNSKVYIMVFILATGICLALLTLMLEVCIDNRLRKRSVSYL